MNEMRVDKLKNKIVKTYIKQAGGITYMTEKIVKPPKLTLAQLFEGKPKSVKKKKKKP